MSASEQHETQVLNKESLRQLIIAGARRVIAHRELLDRINVFPVPDNDTGTNLSLTMRAVLDGLQQPQPSLAAVSSTVATSALTGAQGNSGVIFAQFFQGLREEISDSVHVSMQRFASALRCAATRAREALAQPREGTILTVISDVAEHLGQSAERLPDFRALLDEGLAIARRSLEKTTDRLAELKAAGVVDAGALGFVHFLEGVRDFFHFGAREDEVENAPDDDRVSLPESTATRFSFRYCTEAVVWGEAIDRRAVMARLMEMGDSVAVAGDSHEIHAHVHTNAPAYALEYLASVGTIARQKVDDMLASVDLERNQLPEDERGGIALVTDSVCDLPMPYLTENRIHSVPVRVVFGDEPLLDRVDITPTQFYQRLRSETEHPKTSQPKPADFLALYRYLAGSHSSVLSVHLSAEVSGTHQSAVTAAKQVSTETGVPIAVIDTRSASAAEGLVVWATARAIQSGLSPAQCTAVANTAAQSTSVYVFVPTIRYFVRGGRLSPAKGKLVGLLRMLPVLTSENGHLTRAGMAIGKRAAKALALRKVMQDAAGMEKPLFIVSHTAAPSLAEHARDQIAHRFPDAKIWITDTAPAIGSHAGPGGLALAVLDAGALERRIQQEASTS